MDEILKDAIRRGIIKESDLYGRCSEKAYRTALAERISTNA
jgi:hypothetical protein